MLEPDLVHKTKINSLHAVVLYRVGPVFAVVDCEVDGSGWKFTDTPEEALHHYIQCCQERQEDEIFMLRWQEIETEEYHKTGSLQEAMQNARKRLAEEFDKPWMLDWEDK